MFAFFRGCSEKQHNGTQRYAVKLEFRFHGIVTTRCSIPCGILYTPYQSKIVGFNLNQWVGGGYKATRFQ